MVQHGLRPTPPPHTPPTLAAVMAACWHKNPAQRPSFMELVPTLETLLRQLREQESTSAAAGAAAVDGRNNGGFFSKFRGKPSS